MLVMLAPRLISVAIFRCYDMKRIIYTVANWVIQPAQTYVGFLYLHMYTILEAMTTSFF